jgi:exodeoxyribonuclease V alpha subunit
MQDEETEEAFTATGLFTNPVAGAEFLLEGDYTESKYGRQFKVNSMVEKLPASLKGLERYLGSGLIQGIGKVNAHKIVEAFGLDTISIIEEEPDRLLQLEGIGKKKLSKITKAWNDQKEIKNVMIFLQGYGVSPAYAVKIYKAYGNDSIRKVKKNPYSLIRDVWGIGFTLADNLARSMGIGNESEERIRAGVFFILEEMSKSGHCYATFEELTGQAARVLLVGEEMVEGEIRYLAREGIIISDYEDIFYLPFLYHCEVGIKNRVEEMMKVQLVRLSVDEVEVVEEVSRTAGILYDDIQLSGIRMSLTSRLMVLTGGPGTGKTTTVMGIIRALEMGKRSILLAAPTGRAAKRMTETTGKKASTIHRLLEFSPAEGFQRNEENPLECDTLILDEASMVDVSLMYTVLRALPDTATLILVGDVDQLPAVGPGNVLRDFIDSEMVDVVCLERIFRQAKTSAITENAHRVNRGEMVAKGPDLEDDFFFMEESDTRKLLATIKDLVARRLPNRYQLDPLKDIQVLTPMQKGDLGAKNLNKELQEVLNPESTKIIYGLTEYRLHDRVMQIRNNYEKRVFNGDIGTISNVDLDTKQLLVNFAGDELVYDLGDLDELVLAYAVTIHKSQGSEYPVVITPLTMSHYMMLQRNLVYTAITRAEKLMILLGEKRALRKAINTNDVKKRNTMLKVRLQEMLQ